MKSFLSFSMLSLMILILLTGCPEEVGNELDTSLYVKNNLNDSLKLRIYGKSRLAESDSVLTQTDKGIIYSFLSNSSLVLSFDSAETREFPNTYSKETIIESPIGEHTYLINVDSLLNYTSATWDGKAGVKH